MSANGRDGQNSILRKVILSIGFAFATLGFLNSIPDYAFLPSIGIIPAVILHPVALASGLTISFLTLWNMETSALRPVVLAVAAIGLAIGYFVLWRYYIDVSALENIGLFFFQASHAWIALAGCLVVLFYAWRVWGPPLAIVGGVALLYFFTGESWPGIFGHAGMNFVNDTPAELWFNTGDGVLGNIMAILVNTVFPFIILGAVLEGTGGGGSLIKISFHAMRRFRGGPAHAAIMASSLFGTVSGSAVANVVGTGVITIPMIKKRGFSPTFAGGVEATASTGGQIMPPIMGAAALVMADFIAIDYLVIIIAALIPAIAYYVSLFTTVVFEARSLGVEVTEASDLDPITVQDWINLVLVAVPITLVVIALIMGFSPAGSAMLALVSLIFLSFINPDIRRRPLTLAASFARGGVTFGRLLMATATIGIVVAVLGSTGLPLEFAIVMSQSAGDSLLLALLIAALASLALGMGMPTLPAYLTIVIILGPSLTSLGLTDLTAHFFVFYFGVASAITPPVAMAAFAAASIAGGGAIGTAVQATRIGLVIFAIPFLFAFNPVMLIVEEAGAEFSAVAFLYLLVRLVFLIYLVASAMARFDRTRIPLWESAGRLVAGLALIHPSPVVSGIAMAVGAALVGLHYLRGTRAETVS